MKRAVFNTGAAFDAAVLINDGTFAVSHSKDLMGANFGASPTARALALVQF